MKQILQKYPENIAGNETHYPLSKVPPVEIEDQSVARQIKVPAHRLPTDEEEMVQDGIAEMAAKGILKKIQDPKGVFPFFFEKIKGSLKAKKRTAVDFRRLNPWLKVVHHQMPTVDELVDSVSNGFKHIWTLDIAKAYLQQPVNDPRNYL